MRGYRFTAKPITLLTPPVVVAPARTMLSRNG